jgi:hypothetical protein
MGAFIPRHHIDAKVYRWHAEAIGQLQWLHQREVRALLRNCDTCLCPTSQCKGLLEHIRSVHVTTRITGIVQADKSCK